MSIYLDNAATTYPKPEQVYLAVDHALRGIGVSPGRGSHRRSLEASRILFEAREGIGAMFGISDSSRVVFTHSATEALNMAVNGFLRPGDHVVSTSMEHNSLARPLRMAERRGVEVTWVPGDNHGMVDWKGIMASIRGNTRMVALSHCSNVTGAIQPIGEIGAVTSKSGVALLVDAAQSAGSIPIDVKGMGIDLLAVPGHKGLLGPQGTGFLYVGEGVDLAPLMVGGTGGFSSSEDQPEQLPERFESGTLNMPGIAGFKAGVDFIAETGIGSIRKKEMELVAQLLEGISATPGTVHYSPPDPADRGGLVSFTIPGRDPAEIGYRLDSEFDIAVRVGLHCNPGAHRIIGTYPGGTVRVSPGWFNTTEDIEEILRAIRSIAG